MGEERLLQEEEAGRLAARLLRFQRGRKLSQAGMLSATGVSRSTWHRMTGKRKVSPGTARRVCSRLGLDYVSTIYPPDRHTCSGMLTAARLQTEAAKTGGDNLAGGVQLVMSAATLLYSEMLIRGIPVMMTCADLERVRSAIIFSRNGKGREVTFYLNRRRMCYQLATLDPGGRSDMEGFGVFNEVGFRFCVEFLVTSHDGDAREKPSGGKAYAKLQDALRGFPTR